MNKFQTKLLLRNYQTSKLYHNLIKAVYLKDDILRVLIPLKNTTSPLLFSEYLKEKTKYSGSK